MKYKKRVESVQTSISNGRGTRDSSEPSWWEKKKLPMLIRCAAITDKKISIS